MSNDRLTLLMALIVSLAGIVMTQHWYNRNKIDVSIRSQQNPIAFLEDSRGELEKRPPTRLLWHEIAKGTPLFAGDSIRTDSSSEGAVKLLASETVIDLEPDSLIVLEEEKGSAGLKLLSGSLLVASTGSGKDGAKAPVIKAGNTKFILGNNETQMSLSKREGEEATVAVGKGNVEVAAKGRRMRLQEGSSGVVGAKGIETGNLITTISPRAGQAIVSLRGATAPINFQWKALPANFQVQLLVGASPAALKVVRQGINGASGTVSFNPGPDDFYWQLTAYGPDKQRLRSITLRCEREIIAPPSLLTPSAGDQLVRAGDNVQSILSWRGPKAMYEAKLYVSRQKDLRNPILSRSLKGENSVTAQFTETGRYYWRVLGAYEGYDRILGSEIGSFEVVPAVKLAPPNLLKPRADDQASRQQARDGITFQWSRSEGASSYVVEVREGKRLVTSTIAEDPRIKLTTLVKGQYNWRVRALNAVGEPSEWTATRRLNVYEMSRIRWLEPRKRKVTYSTGQPSVDLVWSRSSGAIAGYQIRAASRRAGLDSAPWKQVGGNRTTMTHAAPGSYFYEVRALAGDGSPVGYTSPLRLELTPVPQLAAPTLLGAANRRLQSETDGSLVIKWQPVSGAERYQVEITNAQTGKAKHLTSSLTRKRVTGLLPGRYRIRIRSIDQQGREGKYSAAYSLTVPERSNIPAPDIDNLRIH